ncbi:MAG: hypothetical protein H0X24_05785 [Ktedonobacterales bacterium]|nr:hypothetical protein [Ktedonobacterales bacterium]
MAEPSAVGTANVVPPAPPTTDPRWPSTQITLPIVAILGYTAFFISGFGVDLKGAQSLPIYIFLGLLLLALQTIISETRTPTRFLYVLLTSGFALFYAAEVYFNRVDNFARASWFYFTINVLLVIVFIYDAVARRLPGQAHINGQPMSARQMQLNPFSFASFATDFAGLAVLFYTTYGLLNLIASIPIGLDGNPIVITIKPPIGSVSSLAQLDLVGGFSASAVALLLTGIVGVLAVAGQNNVSAFVGDAGKIATVAVNQVLLSLRLVLGPLVWLIPSFALANFSDGFVQYLNNNASVRNTSIGDLFNPFTASAVNHYPQAFENIGLLLLAAAAVILAVAVVEHNGQVIQRTLRLLGIAGITVSVVLFLFIFSLAAVNAVLLIFNPSARAPFQVGGDTLIALGAAIVVFVYTAITSRGQGQSAPPPAPAA